VSKFFAFNNPFDGLPNELNTDKHQEYTITKPSQSVELSPAKWLVDTGRPFTGYSCTEADH